MAKKYRQQKISPQTQEDSLKIARATQRPGQTKEQTKLIAHGIEKGINQYKKQHKEKSRELSRKLLRASRAKEVSSDKNVAESQVNTVYRQSILPWLLLLFSWMGFAVYFFIADSYF